MASSLPALFTDLQRATIEGNDDRSLELCNDILKQSPNDQTALHCKVVTLIRLGQYDDALSLIARKFKGTDVDLSFERIYCYYRTNQLKQALELLNDIKAASDTTSPGLLYLEAQLLYSQDKYSECIAVYESLLEQTNKNDPIYEEIQVNLLAAQTGLAFSAPSSSSKPEPIAVSNESQYEVAYNAASLHLARLELDDARKQLEVARKTCNARLTEADVPQEEIDEELAVIATQLAYTYQIQGRVEEAMEIYQSVLGSSTVKDMSIKAVASNNIVAVRQKKKNLSDAAQKLKMATSKEADSRLKRYQKRVIAMNDSLLQLYMSKFEACRDSARKLIATYPENETLYLVLAAATYQQHKGQAAVEELKKYAEEHPSSLAIWFATIQVELLQSQPAAALSTLEQYLSRVGEKNKKEYYRPAVVALLVWLYEQTGQSDKAMELLDKASQFWKTDADFSSEAPTSIMKQTAAFKLKTGRYQDAVTDYEQLVRADPTDAQALAGLIAAYVEVDPAKAEQYGNSLPAVALDHLDMSALETVVPGVKRGYVRKQASSTRTRKPKTKKKRKPLLPKDYDPEKTPDPERWIPKRERSTYRVKGKNKKAASKGPQGTFVAGGGIGGTGSANIGGGSRGTESSSSSPKAETKPSKPASASSNKNANKKKKKKGGKTKW